MGGIYPGQSAARIGCDHLPSTSVLPGGSGMQGQGAPTWSVAIHWVCWSWGFPGGGGQFQPPPEFCLGHPAWALKLSEMAATCAGFGDSQLKSSCDYNLAAPRAHWSQLLLVWYDLGVKTSHSYGKAAWMAPQLGEVEPLWISTVLARLMESQIWYQPTGSVGEGLAQANGLCSPQCQTLQFLPVYYWCPPYCHPSAGTQRESVLVGDSMCGFPRMNFLGLQQPASSTNSIPAGFCSQKLWGLIFLALEPWAGGPSVGPGLRALKISLPNFYPHGCRASPFCICTPPTSLDGCGFFNFIVVRLPYNLISDGPDNGCSTL